MSVSWEIRCGDAREVLAGLPEASVHTCVTSPPYFGLRDYGTAEWEGGDPACDHPPASIREGRNEDRQSMRDGVVATNAGQLRHWAKRAKCEHCGATKTDRQIGLEPSPEEFVHALVAVFREVRRVLRPDGTVWLNLGDSFAAKSRGSDAGWESSRLTIPGRAQKAQSASLRRTGERHRGKGSGIKEKDLIGIPWMVAFALRADGWYLRSEVIWHKPNPMPESVTDRPTRSHEHIFLLSAGPRYFYDADAIREQHEMRPQRRPAGRPEDATPRPGQPKQSWSTAARDDVGVDGNTAGRNKRDVWTVTTKPYAGAHFATFPPDLIEPCILAGAPECACSSCGAPWVRKAPAEVDEPSCQCRAEPVPGVVLDPFAGAGTTGLVALRHGRSFVGAELNPEYVGLARRRIVDDAPLLNAAAELEDAA